MGQNGGDGGKGRHKPSVVDAMVTVTRVVPAAAQMRLAGPLRLPVGGTPAGQPGSRHYRHSFSPPSPKCPSLYPLHSTPPTPCSSNPPLPS